MYNLRFGYNNVYSLFFDIVDRRFGQSIVYANNKQEVQRHRMP